MLETSTIEQYLISEDKQKFIQSLVTGSQDQATLLVYYLLTQERQLTENEINSLENIIKHCKKDNGIHKTLSFRKTLYDLQNEKDEQKKKEIVKKIHTEFFPDIVRKYEQPSNAGQNFEDIQENQISSTVDQNLFSLEKYMIEQSKDLKTIIQNIQPNCFSRLDFKHFLQFQENESLILQILKKGDIESWGDQAIDCIQGYCTLSELNNGYQPSITSLYKRLTIDQLLNLKSCLDSVYETSNFSYILFQKQYQTHLQQYTSKKLSDLSNQQKEEYINLLESILKWAKINLHSNNYSLKDQLVLKILQIQLELENVDLNLFKSYLENPAFYDKKSYLSETHQSTLKHFERYINKTWESYHKLQITEQSQETKLTEEILKFFFKVEISKEKFCNYLDKKYVNKLYYTVRLQQGDSFNNITEYLSQNEISSLEKQRSVTICDCNQRIFKQGEVVKLLVDLKNIQNMTIKVFTIDTENYYIKHKQAFDNSISLDGINPLDQQVDLKFDTNSIQIKRHEFTFEKLTQIPRGLFIIEFQGNGITSRAVIRKGGLTYLEQQTAIGHTLTLINENKEICTPSEEEKTGVWIDGKFLKATQDGYIHIPFGQQTKDYPIILVHNEYAEMANLQILTEQYELKSAFLYTPESFLSGNRAQVVIQNRLYSNSILTDVSQLQDYQVNVSIYNDQNIPSNFTYNYPKLSQNEDIVVDMPIQNLVRNVEISVTAGIKKLNKEVQKLSQNHTIEFNLFESTVISHLFLTFENGNYILSQKGKNGEVRPGQKISISFTNKYLNTTFKEQYQTDKQGQINLGPLKDIVKIQTQRTYECSGDDGHQQFLINNDNRISYQSNIKATENELVQIPVLNSEISKNTYTLTEVSTIDDLVLKDVSSKLQYKNGQLEIPNLKEGSYILKLKDINQEITVDIIRGSQWNLNKDFLITEQTNTFIQRNNSKYQNLQIRNVESTQDQIKIQLNLSEIQEQIENLRVHTFLTGFLPTDFQKQNKQLRDIQLPIFEFSSAFGMKKSVFLNNKQLGDEVCYALDRKNQQKFIGNTLEKPNILLKRTYVKDTQFDQEDLKQDQDFKQGLEDKKIEEKAEVSKKCEKKQVYGEKRRSEICFDYGENSLINYLQNPGILLSNLRINNDGQVVINDPRIKNYKNVEIIVTTSNASVSLIHPLQTPETQFKNLALNSSLKPNTAYIEQQTSLVLQQGQKSKISADSESVILDNTEQLFEIQKQLILASKERDDQQSNGYEFWRFLIEWSNYSKEQKISTYNKYSSHELNIYLYMKDRQFFESTIYKFIKNKIQKTFVDYYLLNDKDNLLKFVNSVQLETLNAMEKCLLVSFLIQNNQEKEAIAIRNLIKSKQDTINISTNQKKRLFSTVMNSKVEQDLAGITQVMDELMGLDDKSDVANFRASSSGLGRFSKKSSSSKIESYFNPGYQQIKATKEYVERSYYDYKGTDFNNMVTQSLFWSDFAQFITENKGQITGFLSTNFIYSSNSHTELLMALAFLDLKTQPGQYQLQALEGRLIEIDSNNGSTIVFYTDISEAEQQISGDINVIQRIFDPFQQATYLPDDPSIKIQKQVEEFIPNTVYECKTIITNCTISSLEFQVLSEIPQGAIPVENVEYIKSRTVTIDSYQNKIISYYFYFPAPGAFRMNPVSVSRNNKVIAISQGLPSIEVKQTKSIKELDSITNILANGSQADILKFIEEKNILNQKIFKFQDIYWLLQKDQVFFQKYLDILRNKKTVDYTSWLISLQHGDSKAFFELLQMPQFLTQIRQKCHFDYFKIDDIVLETNRLFEYYPLLSSRSHNFMNEKKSKILNEQFKQTYEKFIQFLLQVQGITSTHYIQWTYYLLLQERIKEATQIFSKISQLNLVTESQIQYDYMAAYLDIYQGQESNFQTARSIADKYTEYPIISWKNLFKDLSNQLKEYDGVQVPQKDVVQDTELNKNLKQEGQEAFEYEIKDKKIILKYQNTEKINVNYYEIDLEVLFSREPFLNSNSNNFSFVRPNYEHQVQTEKQRELEQTSVDIPEFLEGKNLCILMTSGNVSKQTLYFSSDLQAMVIQNYGQVKVLDKNNTPLAKVYVKCFAKMQNGNVSFYRDGYTDLRGRFDYALSSNCEVKDVQEFALFIYSDDFGSITRYAKPPSQQGQMVSTL